MTSLSVFSLRKNLSLISLISLLLLLILATFHGHEKLGNLRYPAHLVKGAQQESMFSSFYYLLLNQTWLAGKSPSYMEVSSSENPRPRWCIFQPLYRRRWLAISFVHFTAILPSFIASFGGSSIISIYPPSIFSKIWKTARKWFPLRQRLASAPFRSSEAPKPCDSLQNSWAGENDGKIMGKIMLSCS